PLLELLLLLLELLLLLLEPLPLLELLLVLARWLLQPRPQQVLQHLRCFPLGQRRRWFVQLFRQPELILRCLLRALLLWW
ncbi:MAG TPA: hypothetical protein EYQ49_05145, partial [Acidimicrobiia bacterium]|nr:hypothetical protein [Acidimicrobiia bacterium]